MGRRPRLDGPDTWHHVTNRGIAKRPLFEDRADQRTFLALVARQVRLNRIEVHSFCLMHTHFHMLVRSVKGELSEALRRIQNEHSRRFNRRHQRDGTLIRGRFFSKVVDSLTYRAAVVRYIDANPVKARIVATSGEYTYGSARSYMDPTGPVWLTRTWVEQEACETTGASHYSADAYLATFGNPDYGETEELVRSRIESTATEDPLDTLVGAAPARVRRWMQRKARLADGCRVGLPVCGRRAIEAELASSSASLGAWLVPDGRVTRAGNEIALAGMLRDLAGLPWVSIGLVTGRTTAGVRRFVDHHRRLLVTDREYSNRVARVAKSAIERGAMRSVRYRTAEK